jgi:hypothetical protein
MNGGVLVRPRPGRGCSAIDGWMEVKTYLFMKIHFYVYQAIQRQNLTGVATRYGLDGPGIKFQLGWGRRDYPYPSKSTLGPIQPPVQWVPGHFREQIGRAVALITHPV